MLDRPWVPIALAVTLVALGIAQAFAVVTLGPSGDPVTLRLRYIEGDRLTYDIDIRMNGTVSAEEITEPIDLRMKMDLDMDVLDVDGDGVATISVSAEMTSATFGGREIPPEQLDADMPPTELRVAPDGSVLEGATGISTGVTGPASVPGAGQFVPSLPEEPIAPGEEWTAVATQRLTEDGPSITVSVDGRFEGYEAVDGVETAVITSVVDAPMDFEVGLEDLAEISGEALPFEGAEDATIVYSGSAQMEGTTWFDPSRGIQVRSEASGRLDFEFAFSGLEQEVGSVPIPATRLAADLEMSMELE